jgi:hypothetical protein
MSTPASGRNKFPEEIVQNLKTALFKIKNLLFNRKACYFISFRR